QYTDALSAPGTADFTAHVDFSELADVLREAGLVCHGPVSQASFLGDMGFSTRLERLLAGKDARQANAIEFAAHRLIAEPGMGDHFRVLAARNPQTPVLVPFAASVETSPA
ncbi:MAG: SAM-dependent methyltransferase, partial [Hyphomicrobiaceae bacterium]